MKPALFAPTPYLRRSAFPSSLTPLSLPSSLSPTSPSPPTTPHDLRRTHCILCRLPVPRWVPHLLTPRHIALRTLGSHFHSFQPARSRHLLETGLQAALGISSSVLAQERTFPNETRRYQLAALVEQLLGQEVFPMGGEEQEGGRKESQTAKGSPVSRGTPGTNISKVYEYRGRAVLRREVTLLLFRLYPHWNAIQIGALAQEVVSDKNVKAVAEVLGMDRKAQGYLLAVMGHMHNAEFTRSSEVVLKTLTRHCVDVLTFELYNFYIWDVMPHLTTVWDIYLSARGTMSEEAQRMKQTIFFDTRGDKREKREGNVDSGHEEQYTPLPSDAPQDSLDTLFHRIEAEHSKTSVPPSTMAPSVPWLPPCACVTLSLTPGTVSSRIVKIHREVFSKEPLLKLFPTIQLGKRTRPPGVLQSQGSSPQEGTGGLRPKLLEELAARCRVGTKAEPTEETAVPRAKKTTRIEVSSRPKPTEEVDVGGVRKVPVPRVRASKLAPVITIS